MFQRGFDTFLDKVRCGKIICVGRFLIVRKDEMLEFNVEVVFLKLEFINGIFVFEIGTIGRF